MNTRVNYLYRDADNYKSWNTVVIEGEFSEKEISDIYSVLDCGEYWIPHQVGLPELRFQKWDPQSDHIWFEFCELAFEKTEEEPTEVIDARELYRNFLRIKETGWQELSALEWCLEKAVFS